MKNPSIARVTLTETVKLACGYATIEFAEALRQIAIRSRGVKTVAEPVFGQIKQARGFRQFLLRGLEKVKGEWAVICLTHNILKLHRLCYR
jgi:hypothetical protein